MGPENLKKKPLKLVKTRYLTASRRGFAALERQLAAIRREDPTGSLTYRLRAVIPGGFNPGTMRVQQRYVKEIRPFSNLLPTDKELRVKKREGRIAMIEQRIKTDLFTDPEVPETPPKRKGAKAHGKMSKKKARATLNKFKAKKGIKFSVTIFREFS